MKNENYSAMHTCNTFIEMFPSLDDFLTILTSAYTQTFQYTSIIARNFKPPEYALHMSSVNVLTRNLNMCKKTNKGILLLYFYLIFV